MLFVLINRLTIIIRRRLNKISIQRLLENMMNFFEFLARMLSRTDAASNESSGTGEQTQNNAPTRDEESNENTVRQNLRRVTGATAAEVHPNRIPQFGITIMTDIPLNMAALINNAQQQRIQNELDAQVLNAVFASMFEVIISGNMERFDDVENVYKRKAVICGFTPAFSKTTDDTVVLSSKKAQGDLEYHLTCPSSKKALTDPVILSDGYSYNRSVVKDVLALGYSPVTKQWLNPKIQYNNRKLKEFSDWFFDMNKNTRGSRQTKPDLTCPLMMDELQDPVMLSSGHTIDKSLAKTVIKPMAQNNSNRQLKNRLPAKLVILGEGFNQLKKCPFTREKLDLKKQVEDKTLKHVIRAYNKRNQRVSVTTKP